MYSKQIIQCLQNAARLLREPLRGRDPHAMVDRGSAALACDIGVVLIKSEESFKQSETPGTCPSCEQAKAVLGGFFSPTFGNDIASGIAAISLRCASVEKEHKELLAKMSAIEQGATVRLLREARLYIARHTSPTVQEAANGSIVDRIDAFLASLEANKKPMVPPSQSTSGWENFDHRETMMGD